MRTINHCDAGEVLVRPIASSDFGVKAIRGAVEAREFEESKDSGESFVEWARRLV